MTVANNTRPDRLEMHSSVREPPVVFMVRGPQTTYQQFFGGGRRQYTE